jgi:hypothetical protein
MRAQRADSLGKLSEIYSNMKKMQKKINQKIKQTEQSVS